MPHLPHRVKQNQHTDIAIQATLLKGGPGYARNINGCPGGLNGEKSRKKPTKIRDLPHMLKILNRRPGFRSACMGAGGGPNIFFH